MMPYAQKLIERAMADICMSEDRNDQALCAILASALGSWKGGEAQRLLHKIRIVTNREMTVNAPDLAASRN